jgi:hypothetical protein
VYQDESKQFSKLSYLDSPQDPRIGRRRPRGCLVLLVLPIIQLRCASRRARSTTRYCMDVIEICVTSSELNIVVSAMTILLQVSRSCRVRTFPRLRVLSVRTAIRRAVTKDLSHQRPQCSGGGRREADTSLARRPDCDIDRCVEELGGIIEAANEGEPDNRRSGAAVAESASSEGLGL